MWNIARNIVVKGRLALEEPFAYAWRLRHRAFSAPSQWLWSRQGHHILTLYPRVKDNCLINLLLIPDPVKNSQSKKWNFHSLNRHLINYNLSRWELNWISKLKNFLVIPNQKLSFSVYIIILRAISKNSAWAFGYLEIFVC